MSPFLIPLHRQEKTSSCRSAISSTGTLLAASLIVIVVVVSMTVFLACKLRAALLVKMFQETILNDILKHHLHLIIDSSACFEGQGGLVGNRVLDK